MQEKIVSWYIKFFHELFIKYVCIINKYIFENKNEIILNESSFNIFRRNKRENNQSKTIIMIQYHSLMFINCIGSFIYKLKFQDSNN
jgi:hypothetical protein